MNFSSSRPTPSPKPEDRLKAQLRAEALASTPAFSADLHQRTLAVLRANGLKGLDTEALRANRYRLRTAFRIAGPLAAAAAVAIALWINLKPLSDLPAQQFAANDPYILPDPTPSDMRKTWPRAWASPPPTPSNKPNTVISTKTPSASPASSSISSPRSASAMMPPKPHPRPNNPNHIQLSNRRRQKIHLRPFVSICGQSNPAKKKNARAADAKPGVRICGFASRSSRPLCGTGGCLSQRNLTTIDHGSPPLRQNTPAVATVDRAVGCVVHTRVTQPAAAGNSTPETPPGNASQKHTTRPCDRQRASCCRKTLLVFRNLEVN